MHGVDCQSSHENEGGSGLVCFCHTITALHSARIHTRWYCRDTQKKIAGLFAPFFRSSPLLPPSPPSLLPYFLAQLAFHNCTAKKETGHLTQCVYFSHTAARGIPFCYFCSMGKTLVAHISSMETNRGLLASSPWNTAQEPFRDCTTATDTCALTGG